MDEIIATGKADVIEVARELFCEPDFPNMVRAGRDGAVFRPAGGAHGAAARGVHAPAAREQHAFRHPPVR